MAQRSVDLNLGQVCAAWAVIGRGDVAVSGHALPPATGQIAAVCPHASNRNPCERDETGASGCCHT
jgi:hypothetical protein